MRVPGRAHADTNCCLTEPVFIYGNFFFFFVKEEVLVDTCSHFKLQCSSDTNSLSKMKDFLKKFPFRKFSIFFTVIGSFTYNILLDRDVACTCKDVAQDCNIYMFLPFFIIFFLMLWTDKTLERTRKYTFVYKLKGVRTELCSVFLGHIIKAICVGLLWVVSVFIDGDWYVCCNSGTEQSELACKYENNITAEENLTISSLKNKSRVSISFFLHRI